MPVEVHSETLTTESGSLSLGLHEEVLAVSAAGQLSSAQVYFVGPNLWAVPTIFVRLFGRVRGRRLLLREAVLSSVTHTEKDSTLTGAVMAIHGIPVDGFEVVLAQDSNAGAEVSGGRIVLVAGSRSGGAQGMAAPADGRWPMYLSDGAAEVGSADNPLHVRRSDARRAYYVSAVVGTGKYETTGKSILWIWNEASGHRAEIRRITIAYLAGVGGELRVRGSHISELPRPYGGIDMRPGPLDPSDGASSLASVAEGNAPTPVDLDLIVFAVPFSATGTFVWTWTDLGKPIVLPADMLRGFEIRADVSGSASTEMKLHVSIEWVET